MKLSNRQIEGIKKILEMQIRIETSRDERKEIIKENCGLDLDFDLLLPDAIINILELKENTTRFYSKIKRMIKQNKSINEIIKKII